MFPCNQPHTLLTHVQVGGREFAMCFGMQGHSIKPQRQSTALRNEAFNFEESLLMGGVKQLNCKIPKEYQVGNFHSQLLWLRETFASESWQVPIKVRAGL